MGFLKLFGKKVVKFCNRFSQHQADEEGDWEIGEKLEQEMCIRDRICTALKRRSATIKRKVPKNAKATSTSAIKGERMLSRPTA